MSLPQENATLTKVTQGTAAKGARDDWDDPGTEPDGAGATKWEGEEPAYYLDTVKREWTGQGVNVVKVRALIIPSALARSIGVDTNDVITFTAPAGDLVAVAQQVRISELEEIPAELQTARLDLEQ